MDFLPSDAELIQAASLALSIMVVVMVYGYRHALLDAARRAFHRYFITSTSPLVDGDDDAVLPHQKNETAKIETAEMPTPAVDVAALRREERAYAIGAILAHGMLDGERTKAIRAVFGDITGEAYSTVARSVRNHESRVASTLDAPAPEPDAPRVVKVYEGRPEEREVALS